MAQFQALLDRRVEERNRAQLNAGIVAASITNLFREKGSTPVDPIEWVPDYKSRAEEARRPQTLDEQIAILTRVMGCGPGKPSKPN